MEGTIESNFKRVVEQVFNNWTALQLAVEHSMGGPQSHQTALEALNWVCSYCIDQQNVQVEDLTEALEDILDEEFSTVCEDDSPKEVANVLVRFLHCLRQGNVEQFNTEFSKLPVCKIWLSQNQEPAPKVPKQMTPENDEAATSDQQMDVDNEWTVVHSKRKK